jgi:hypothetical protein
LSLRLSALSVVLGLFATAAFAGEDRLALALRGKVTTEVPRATSPIKIDGVIDDDAWRHAARIDVGFEWYPGDNLAPVVKTDCLVTYDSSTLYVAFYAHDPDPKAIRANLQDRDKATSDDTVGFILDPFNDERRGFQFRVNPLGVQMDAVNNDIDRTEDFSWDTIWSSAGRILDDGYVVEVAIPFNSLRFPSRTGTQTWGFIATRDYPRSDRHRMRSAPTNRDVSCLVCQLDKLEGFDGASPGRNIELDPTVTSTLDQEREDFPSGDFSSDPSTEAGITARWGITPNVTLNGTINPDFSQVEADVAQLNVNERFALFYPEKRPFFLEGADLFTTPLNVVFTRTVADPGYGLKLSGKSGKSAFGVFVADDSVNNLIFPSNQESGFASIDQDVTTSVLRYRRDIGSSSNVGVIYTDRRGDDYSNRVGGVDGNIRLNPRDTITFQYLGSATEYPDSVAIANGQPLGRFDGSSLTLSYVHRDSDWVWGAGWDDYSPDFRTDAGFMPRVDTKIASAALARIFNGTQETWYRRLVLETTWARYENYDGIVTDDGIDVEASIVLPRQTEIELAWSPNKEYFDDTTYDNPRQQIFVESRPTRDSYAYFFTKWGKTIDFVNSRQADFYTVEPSVELALLRRLSVSATFTQQRLDVEGGELYTAKLLQTKLVWNFSTRSFVRLILQHDDVRRNPELYVDPVEAHSEELFTQALFSYKINPQTVFLFGYSDNYFGGDSFDLTQADRTLFLKVGYAWVF